MRLVDALRASIEKSLQSALEKSHIKGYYKTVGGKRFWVRPHEDSRSRTLNLFAQPEEGPKATTSQREPEPKRSGSRSRREEKKPAREGETVKRESKPQGKPAGVRRFYNPASDTQYEIRPLDQEMFERYLARHMPPGGTLRDYQKTHPGASHCRLVRRGDEVWHLTGTGEERGLVFPPKPPGSKPDPRHASEVAEFPEQKAVKQPNPRSPWMQKFNMNWVAGGLPSEKDKQAEAVAMKLFGEMAKVHDLRVQSRSGRALRLCATGDLGKAVTGEIAAQYLPESVMIQFSRKHKESLPHEFAHYLDFEVLPSEDVEKVAQFASTLLEYKVWERIFTPEARRYVQARCELFARAYETWIESKLPASAMKRDLTAVIERGPGTGLYWSEESRAKLIPVVEAVIKKNLGLIKKALGDMACDSVWYDGLRQECQAIISSAVSHGLADPILATRYELSPASVPDSVIKSLADRLARRGLLRKSLELGDPQDLDPSRSEIADLLHKGAMAGLVDVNKSIGFELGTYVPSEGLLRSLQVELGAR